MRNEIKGFPLVSISKSPFHSLFILPSAHSLLSVPIEINNFNEDLLLYMPLIVSLGALREGSLSYLPWEGIWRSWKWRCHPGLGQGVEMKPYQLHALNWEFSSGMSSFNVTGDEGVERVCSRQEDLRPVRLSTELCSICISRHVRVNSIGLSQPSASFSSSPESDSLRSKPVYIPTRPGL